MGTPEADPVPILEGDLDRLRDALRVASLAGEQDGKRDVLRLKWALRDPDGMMQLAKMLEKEAEIIACNS